MRISQRELKVTVTVKLPVGESGNLTKRIESPVETPAPEDILQGISQRELKALSIFMFVLHSHTGISQRELKGQSHINSSSNTCNRNLTKRIESVASYFCYSPPLVHRISQRELKDIFVELVFIPLSIQNLTKRIESADSLLLCSLDSLESHKEN